MAGPIQAGPAIQQQHGHGRCSQLGGGAAAGFPRADRDGGGQLEQGGQGPAAGTVGQRLSSSPTEAAQAAPGGGHKGTSPHKPQQGQAQGLRGPVGQIQGADSRLDREGTQGEWGGCKVGCKVAQTSGRPANRNRNPQHRNPESELPLEVPCGTAARRGGRAGRTQRVQAGGGPGDHHQQGQPQGANTRGTSPGARFEGGPVGRIQGVRVLPGKGGLRVYSDAVPLLPPDIRPV
jgi:hypothetical protein